MLSGGRSRLLVIARGCMAAPRIMRSTSLARPCTKIIDQVYEILMRLRSQRKLTC